MGYWSGTTNGAYPSRYPADDAVDVLLIPGWVYGRWVGPPAAWYYRVIVGGQDSGLLEPGDWFYAAARFYPTLEYDTSYDWYIVAYDADGETVIATSPTWTFTTEENKVELISPTNNANNVHAKDLLTAEVVNITGESVVNPVQLYLNDVKVYDSSPQGAKPYLQW